MIIGLLFLLQQLIASDTASTEVLRCDRPYNALRCLETFKPRDTTVRSVNQGYHKVNIKGRSLYLGAYIAEASQDVQWLAVYSFDSVRSNEYVVRHLDDVAFLPSRIKLMTAFTANADADAAAELIVLLRWELNNINFRGFTFQAFAYDIPREAGAPWQKLANFDQYLPRESEAMRQGERLHARYNTEAKIRRRLKQLGY